MHYHNPWYHAFAMNSGYEEYKTIYVVGALIVRGRKIFATQRGYGNYAGWWEFPGGKVEQGEAPEAALARELKEELEGEIIIERYFDTVEYDYPEFHVSMQCYLCRLASEDLILLEHSSALWLGRDDIFSVKWLGADFPILESLIEQGFL
jgi:8-oxo-dGTP diphosphatase